METNSRHSYSETLARLSKAIVDSGSTIFVTIDQAQAAASVGLHLRPTSMILFGNPKGGTPVMESHPLFALELPLKLLVWEESGGVKVAHQQMSAVARIYGIPEDDPRIAAMDHALISLSTSVN